MKHFVGLLILLSAQLAWGIDLCRWVFHDSPEIAMAKSILESQPYAYSSKWARQEQIRQTARKLFGADTQISGIFKLDAEAQAQRALKIITARQIAYQGITEASALPQAQIRIRSRLGLLLRSRVFEQFGFASSVYMVASHGGLPYVPEFRILKLSPAELNTLVEKGVDSIDGKRLVQAKAKAARLQAHSEWVRRVYLVLTMSVTAYLISEDFAKAEEAEAREAFLKLFEYFKTIDESKEEIKTKEDLHYEVTLENLESKHQRKMSVEELGELCSIIPSPRHCQ